MPTTYERERQLEQEIAPRVREDLPGVDVLAVELVTPSRFCVYVDSPEGVDHALCERVTGLLRDYLREYTVDVSSPGIERPLRRPEHFARYAGHKVALRTAEPLGGRSKFKGVVVEAGPDSVVLDVADGERRQIPYAAIVRGNLIDERV